MGGAEQPGATHSATFWREHGEDCEHRTFPGVSTVALPLLMAAHWLAKRHLEEGR